MHTNIAKRCRICTSRNAQMMSIFEHYDFSGRTWQVSEVITKCAVVQIRKLDGFSEQICDKCLEHLSQAFSFKQLCEDSDYKFRHNLIVEERIVSQDADCDKVTNVQHCDNNENNIKEEVDCISSDVIFEIKNESSGGETRNHVGIAENELHKEIVGRISIDVKEFFAEDTKIFYGDSQLQNENVTNTSTRELQNGIDELSAQNRAKIHVNEVNNGILNISDVSPDEESDVDMEEIESEHDFSNEQLQEENVRKTSTSTLQDLDLQSTIMPNENSQISWKGKNLEEENSHICTCFNRTILNNHRGIDKECYKCEVCGKYFKCKPALIRLGRLHFSGTTNNESPNYNSDMNDHTGSFKCETCGKILTKKRSLSSHMKIHTGGKPFKCKTCEKSFSRKIALINHLRIHTGEKPFKCKTCGKSFRWKATLNYHLRIHTGKKPFKCDTRGKSFSRKLTLNNHLRIQKENVRRISIDVNEFFAEDTKIFYGNSQLHNENVTNSSTGELQNGIDELSAQNQAKIHVNEVNNGINISDVSPDEESDVDMEEIESEHDFSNEQLQEENVRKTSTSTLQDLNLQSTIMPNENSQISWKGKNLEEEKSHICTYFNRTILNNHRGIDKECYKCKVCGKYFKCKPALIRLGRLHFSGTTNNESPNYNSDMNDHTGSFQCDTCGKILTKKRSLSRHMKIHTGGKPFKCKTCEKSFSRKLNLINHLRIHTEKKPFKFETCSKSFCWKATLNDHLRIHKGKKPFKCDMCGKSFSQKIIFNNHLRIHTGEKPFKCDTCAKSFSRKIILINHLRIHTGEKPFKCDTCAKSFSRKITLINHLRIHTGEKPFKCETCGKSFSQKLILNNHLRIHTGEKPFKCEICGKSYKQKVHLKSHVRNHTGEKPFKCETCGKSFSQKIKLNEHLRVHTGEEPFKCEICGKSFKQKVHLKMHVRIHTGEKPFKCETCGKCFIQKQHLNSHMNVHA